MEEFPNGFRRSRLEQTKKKRENFLLNMAIAIVTILIIIIGGKIILDKEEPKDRVAEEQKQEDKEQKKTETSEKNAENNEQTNEQTNEDESENDLEIETEEQAEEAGTIVQNSNDPNVQQVIIDPNWKPIGTVQTGEHVTTYDQNSVDWQEMEKALAYGANIPHENMVVWWLENGGSPELAVGTISTNDNHEQAYRVYIEWVDGQGWKPIKVEQLIKNDKKQ